MSRKKMIGAAICACVVVGAFGVVPEGKLSVVAQGSDPTLALASRVDEARALDTFGELPLSFEANRGQADTRVDFLSRDGEHGLFVTPTEAVLSLGAPEGEHALRMQIVGGDPEAEPMVEQALAGRVNYLRGNDPAQWQTDIPTFGRVGYRGVYPGVDLAYYGRESQLEYDFVVAPGADANAIGLTFVGADDVAIDSAGELVLDTPVGEVRQAKPFIYQDIGGDRRQVEGRFALLSDDRVGFDLGAYDRSQSLVIDPVFVYSTHLGGNRSDRGQGIAVDTQGNAYVSGETCSGDFPTVNPFQDFGGPSDQCGPLLSDSDVFVTKMAPDGSLVYSTFLGGSGRDRMAKLAVDGDARAHVTGETNSSDFPTTEGALQQTRMEDFNPDVFVSELNADGSGLAYSTFLGGANSETLPVIDLDLDGNIFVAGESRSFDFPITPGAFQDSPCDSTGLPEGHEFCESIFLAKIDPEGNGPADLVYSSFLGTDVSFRGKVGLAVDATGNANLTGGTRSTNFPTTLGALQPGCALNPDRPKGFQCEDAFVTRIDPAGNGQDDLVYSTFLGGTESISGGIDPDFYRGRDHGTDVAVGPDGAIYVTGEATSEDFPITVGAFQSNLAGCSPVGCDSFVTKIDPAGEGEADLVYSTFVGGGGAADLAQAIAVDSAGRAVVAGDTYATSFPLADPLQPRCGCFTSIFPDAFVIVLDPLGQGTSDLVFSTFLGGTGFDFGNDVVVGSSDDLYVVGSTDSPPTSGGELGPKQFPTTPGAFQPEPVGGFDAFVSRIDLQSTSPPPGLGGLSVADAKRVEGDIGTRLLEFTVTLAEPNLDRVVEVRYRTVDGTAEAPGDYRAQRGTLRFRPGATTKTVAVIINVDTDPEADETFVLELFKAKRAPIDDAMGTGTIVNDD